ncbi:MAG: UDP-N-acetylmuramoyl-tripeptide--D-alanyl-D-alanine ligase [bacterium]|nr:UDP-N-acetylmuramoyl-tripeptide--D-alanyl-D-alanine ligase [bacterium]
MKKRFQNLLNYILKVLARAMIWRYRPGIIGVTGSVGKTGTKQAIVAVFGSDRRVRASHGNFNTSLGHPLTILGDWRDDELKLFSLENKIGENRARKSWFLIKVIFLSLFRLIFKKPYPELLILEYGVDRPGDMRELLQIVRPNIAIITAIGEIPAHVEYFSGPEAVGREKARLIEFLPAAGFAILNSDDMTVMNVKERTRAKIINFGFGSLATVRITNFEHRTSSDGMIGTNFKIEYGGSFVPMRLNNCIGKSHAYAVAASVCVGLIFGLNLVRIAENLKNYRALKGRSLILKGVKDTLIIDDSYNASPMSMHAGLDTLKSLKAKRKIAVLGDMLEIGEYTLEAHEEIGRLVAKSADLLITVGSRAKFIAEGAKKAKMQRKYIKEFETADDARIAVQDIMRKGDLVLVKASRSMELDKIVEEIRMPDELNIKN